MVAWLPSISPYLVLYDIAGREVNRKKRKSAKFQNFYLTRSRDGAKLLPHGRYPRISQICPCCVWVSRDGAKLLLLLLLLILLPNGGRGLPVSSGKGTQAMEGDTAWSRPWAAPYGAITNNAASASRRHYEQRTPGHRLPKKTPKYSFNYRPHCGTIVAT